MLILNIYKDTNAEDKIYCVFISLTFIKFQSNYLYCAHNIMCKILNYLRVREQLNCAKIKKAVSRVAQIRNSHILSYLKATDEHIYEQYYIYKNNQETELLNEQHSTQVFKNNFLFKVC